MTYFTASELRARTGNLTASTAEGILTKSEATGRESFDISLNHSVRDAAAILGLMQWFEAMGWLVYVDWVVDRQLAGHG